MPANTLFDRLKAACIPDWQAYTRHEFVQALGAGTLPEAAFRHYLQHQADCLMLVRGEHKHGGQLHRLPVIKPQALRQINF